MREHGKERSVTKMRSTIVRAFDNAGSKGQNQAINTIFNHSARMVERGDVAIKGLTTEEDELINAWINSRKIGRRNLIPASEIQTILDDDRGKE